MKEKRILAFDFGGSSGRAMIGIFNGEKITLEEVHRFSNDPVIVGNTMYWDILRLFHEIKQGLIKANHSGGFDSVGIDTWGVDFGLLDKQGNLLENPIHYRDSRTQGMLEESLKLIPQDEFYKITGNQFMEINTAFQLLSLHIHRPDILDRAETMLLTPDLFNYFLSGVKSTEYSIASTTQLLDAQKREWSEKVISSLGLPKKIFTKIVPSGTIIGQIRDEICEEIGVGKADIISVAAHDTQSALVAVPAKDEDFLFISCGTWSLVGTELNEPLINKKSAKYNITNEGGYGNKATFLKNIIGLWLIQESRRQWIREGKEYSFKELEDMANKTQSSGSIIDPDAPEFVPPGNIPERIKEYCRRTGQKVPESIGEIVRCINESLALKYKQSIEEIEECTHKTYDTIYIVGGGTQSELLCQLTADICNRTVIAGPVEATVLGNIATQLIALGEIGHIARAKEVIMASTELKTYVPKVK
ncbi:rhamnulokinase/L-fuculokinase [Mobilisporobacter senegalensis]|uniref:Rhamnulokinase/L-fuculokinase n=1 Tax=Mobilisporobacter senegalensis TaxID=1329262 RepID=A0A3N1XUZ5_9FIRM|nr:rhamnulokinase family protein [Mobilisporobacter senegalensis]ROR30455.1 rhamnulokinase/L-fuculokinase [Mobilisporobacter senegalensis]